jgi:hypothetical protein
MGLSISQPAFIQINDKRLSKKEFLRLKTFRDVLKVAGHEKVDDNAALRLIYPKHRVFVQPHEPFVIAEGLQYEEHSIYIRKLYGRNS